MTMPTILTAGPAPAEAQGVLLLVHGRGAPAQSMIALYEVLAVEAISAIAPQAPGMTWYPQSFLAPRQANQPDLDEALATLDTIVRGLLDSGIGSERIALLGFSQGACLALEFAVRHPRRYGAVMALTGGLIGPPGSRFDYPGTLAGTPVLLATSDPDPHVPFQRVEETHATLTRMEAAVELRRYPGMPHTINDDELDACRALIQRVAAGSRSKEDA